MHYIQSKHDDNENHDQVFIKNHHQVDSQRQFLVVCGNITMSSVTNFLEDFFHPCREDVNAEVVILNKMSPDLEFEGLLKRERTRVQYFQVISTFILKFSIPTYFAVIAIF